MSELHRPMISVAIATYNGEKFLEEQLQSILDQTEAVHEIVISDDGSSDRTLNVARKIAKCEKAKDIRFVILQDNPRRGPGSNFEWALSHCTGDYLFVCGQDDIWLPNKVQEVLSAFESNPQVSCVLHDAKLIDSEGNEIQGDFMNHPGGRALIAYCEDQKIVTIPQSFLQTAFQYTLVSGIAIAIRKKMLDGLFPIPERMEDQWIEFKAIAEDSCLFIHEELALYRKHTNNVSGSKSRGMKRLSRCIKYLKSAGNRDPVYFYPYEFSTMCLKQMERQNLKDLETYQSVASMNELGLSKKAAYDRGGILGALQLIRMYQKDLLYRRSSGHWGLFFDILFVFCQKNKN